MSVVSYGELESLPILWIVILGSILSFIENVIWDSPVLLNKSLQAIFKSYSPLNSFVSVVIKSMLFVSSKETLLLLFIVYMHEFAVSFIVTLIIKLNP